MDQTDHRSCGNRTLAYVDIINCFVANDLLPSLLKSARLPQVIFSLVYHTFTVEVKVLTAIDHGVLRLASISTCVNLRNKGLSGLRFDCLRFNYCWLHDLRFKL